MTAALKFIILSGVAMLIGMGLGAWFARANGWG